MIIGFCNPLLDISLDVPVDFLERHQLKANDAILADSHHAGLHAEVASAPNLLYSAGGAGQNAMRAAQWLLPARSVGFMGAVGEDENGERLRAAAEGDGLEVVYMKAREAATGTCLCLLTPGHRSLVASLNAATHFNADHLCANEPKLKAAAAFYISGFLLSDSFSVPKYLASYAQQHQKKVYLNLSAPFICSFFTDRVKEIIPSCAIVFGNESEARALAQAAGFKSSTDDVEKIAQELAFWLADSPRMVVITQGPDSTICYDPLSQSVRMFPVPAVDDIVDTTGAGDAFVGAFVSQHLLGKSLDECVHAGHIVAQIVIRQSGISFPPALRPSL